MLFVSFLLQSVSLIALMVTVFFIERIQQLVGRPDGSYKLLAAIFGLIINALCVIGVNNGQFADSSWGMGAIVSHLFAAGLLLTATYELRNYARVRALSRLNTENPAPKAPAPAAAPVPPPAGEDAGEPQILCNSDMEVIEINRGAARLLGRERSAVTGKSITNLVRKEEMLLVPELFRQVKAGEAHGGEWSFRRPDESLVPVRISVRQHSEEQTRLVLHDLTEEREAAKKEGASTPGGGNDQLIVSLLDASADGYVAFDPDLKIVAWNSRMEKLTGVLRDQCLNQHLLMHFPVPEELAEEDYFLESLEGHSNDISNAPILNPGANETHIVDHHFAPLFNTAKEIIGGMVIVRKPVPVSSTSEGDPAVQLPEEEPTPITFAIPGAEAATEPTTDLPAEETPVPPAESPLLQNTFAAAAHVVSVFDLEAETEIYANRSLAQELGFNDAQIAELGDQPLHEIIHPEDQPNIPRTSGDWNDGSGIARRITEFRAIDPERQWHWFQSADTVLERDSHGGIIKIVSIIRNITQDKEDERQLRLAEQKYRTFSEYCPTGIWHLTPGGQTHYVNPAMCRILGIDSPDEMADRTYYDFITQDSQLSIATQPEPNPGETPTVEIEILRPDGSIRKCLLHGQAELDEAGQIRNLMGSFVDITDRAEPDPTTAEPATPAVDEEVLAGFQSQLRESDAKLQAAESERDEFKSTLELVKTELEQSRASARELQSARDDALALAEDSNSRIGELESQLESVRNELAGKETVQLDVRTAHEDLKSALEAAQTALATTEAERDESKNLLAELNRELDDVRKELDLTKSALAESQSAREAEAKTLKEAQDELEITKSFLDTANSEQQQAKQSLSETQSEAEAAQTALAEAEKSRDEANQSLDAARFDLEATKAALAEAEKSRDEANQSSDAARSELETAKTALAEAEKSRDEANQSSDAARSELETTKDALAETKKSRDEANQSSDAARSELETSKDALAEAEKSRDEANQSSDAARSELESIKTTLTETEKSRDESNQSLEAARSELESIKATLTEAEKSRDEANQFLDTARSDLESTKTTLTEAEKSRDEANHYLGETRAELESTKTALAKARKENEQTLALLTETESERDKTNESLNDQLAELDRLKSELNDEKATREEADSALADIKGELQQAESTLKKAESARKESEAVCAELRSELATVKDALAESETVHLEVKSFQDETSAALTAAQAALAVAEASRDKNADDLKQVREELQQTRDTLTVAKAARDQTDKSLERAQSELEQSKSAQDDLKTKLNEANKQLEQTESDLAEAKAREDEANKALEDAGRSREEFDQKLATLQTELDETKSALTAAESARQETATTSKAELDAARAKLSEIETSLNQNETALELAEAAIAELENKHKDAKDALLEANRKLQEQEDAIAESRRRFSNLQYHLTGIAYRQKNDDGRSVEFISVGCAAFTGHAPEQFTSGNKSVLGLIHPDDREPVAKAMAEAAQAGQGYQVDYRLMHADGTERRVSDRGCGVFNEKKELLAFEGVITEVVERKSGGDLAETALHTLPAGIWITNAEGRTTYNNETWTEITGFESGNGLDWSEAVHGEDRARVVRAFKDAASRHERCEDVFRVRQRDGQFCWMRLIATPRLDSRERFTGYLGTCFDITENIHAEENLKAGQRQMEWAQTRAKLGSWEYHPATNVRRWSRQTALIYNLRPDQEPPDSVEEYLQLMHKDDRARIAATNDQVLKTGRPAGNLELRTNPEKGPQRHLIATVHRVPEEDGSAYYLAGTVMDVSEQRAAEENVRRSEARYRKIIEIAEEGVWMMDAEGYTSFVNPRMMQMLGYRYREFIGRHFFEFLASESAKEAEEYLERRQQGISEQAEFVFLRKDGKPVNVLINSSSLKDADGDFIGILSLVSDITARKAANAEAEKQQQQIRTVLATAPDFILSVDERKIVRFINREYAGMKPELIVGTPALNWVTPDHRERYDEALQDAFEKGEAQDFDMDGLGPDNTTATYRTRIRPVREDDQVTSLIVVSQDVTGQEPATSAAVAADAGPTDERLTVFSRQLLTERENDLRMIAKELHDEFGQSLSATKITLQTIAQSEKNAKNRKRIEGSLESLERLISKTRELSHNLRPPALDDLGLFPALRWLVNERGSTGFEIDFQAEEIGRLDTEIETAAFRIAEDALANVAQHAKAKAATVSMRKEDERLQLSITDNGRGFDPAKAREAARAGKTSGLLRMEERVGLVGGSITIDSKKGKGATIEVSIPLSSASASAKPRRKSRKKSK